MNYSVEISALVIGFLGSFHCVGMCGPIALALSGGKEQGLRYLIGRSLYNAGRIVTYSLLGLLAGLAGHTLLLAGFQKSFSIAIGILMILLVLLTTWLPGFFRVSPGIVKLTGRIKKIFGYVLHRGKLQGFAIAGIANGILPCGFVYLALAGAAATQHPVNGSVYMIMFGLGTFPAMMAISVFGRIAGINLRKYLLKAAPVLMILLGLFFIYRGYNMKSQSCCHGDKADVSKGITITGQGNVFSGISK